MQYGSNDHTRDSRSFHNTCMYVYFTTVVFLQGGLLTDLVVNRQIFFYRLLNVFPESLIDSAAEIFLSKIESCYITIRYNPILLTMLQLWRWKMYHTCNSQNTPYLVIVSVPLSVLFIFVGRSGLCNTSSAFLPLLNLLRDLLEKQS